MGQQLSSDMYQIQLEIISSPKHALTNPYQTHPARPISHRPWVLAAKLNGVPSTLTSRSLAEMLTSRRFMGVRRARYLQNSASTRKLLRNPKVPMKPRHTATTRCPLGLRVGGGSEPDTSSYVAAVPPSGQCAQLRLTLHTIIPGWVAKFAPARSLHRPSGLGASHPVSPSGGARGARGSALWHRERISEEDRKKDRQKDRKGETRKERCLRWLYSPRELPGEWVRIHTADAGVALDPPPLAVRSRSGEVRSFSA